MTAFRNGSIFHKHFVQIIFCQGKSGYLFQQHSIQVNTSGGESREYRMISLESIRVAVM